MGSVLDFVHHKRAPLSFLYLGKLRREGEIVEGTRVMKLGNLQNEVSLDVRALGGPFNGPKNRGRIILVAHYTAFP